MLVRELIELLATFPQEAEVIVLADEGSNQESYPFQVFEDEGRCVIDTSFAADEADQAQSKPN